MHSCLLVLDYMLIYYTFLSGTQRKRQNKVSVKFSSVIHLTVDNYYLRGFGFISISV